MLKAIQVARLASRMRSQREQLHLALADGAHSKTMVVWKVKSLGLHRYKAVWMRAFLPLGRGAFYGERSTENGPKTL